MKIFISYSRKDKEIISPLVEIMRSTNANVFRDTDNLKPGDNWKIKIDDALENCQTFMIFWCIHSACSSPVFEEMNLALKLNKRIIPILIDDTELHPSLASFQWIDLRKIVGKHLGRGKRDEGLNGVVGACHGNYNTIDLEPQFQKTPQLEIPESQVNNLVDKYRREYLYGTINPIPAKEKLESWSNEIYKQFYLILENKNNLN